MGESPYNPSLNDTKSTEIQRSGESPSTRTLQPLWETMGNQSSDFQMLTLALPKSVLRRKFAQAAFGTESLAYLIKKFGG